MFDYLMQVGKTPTVTQDLSLNPLGMNMDDISNFAVVYMVQGTTATRIQGSPINLTNPFFNYFPTTLTAAGNDGLRIEYDSVGTDTNIYIDFYKSIYIRGVSLYFTSLVQSGRVGITVNLQTSQDGQTWTTISTHNCAVSTAIQHKTIEGLNLQGKSVRINIQNVGGTSTSIIYLQKLRVWIDNKQTFY